jgi:6-phosphogluconolactonase
MIKKYIKLCIVMKIVNGSREELEKFGSEFLFDKLSEVLKDKDHVVFGVVGGRSVSGILSELGSRELDWERVHVFFVDERFDSIDSDVSNFKVVSESLGKGVIHGFDYKKDIKEYWDEFLKYGNGFDVVLLSSGEDGHVGMLYPEHLSVKNDDEGFIFIDDSPKPPSKRVGFTRRVIEKAESGVLVFLREGKREAFERFEDASVSVEECPAKLFKCIDDGLVLVGR